MEVLTLSGTATPGAIGVVIFICRGFSAYIEVAHNKQGIAAVRRYFVKPLFIYFSFLLQFN
jgi:hypothetical protein